jgi:thiamine monophosphate synthase
LTVGADGVHIGGRSVDIADARRLSGPGALLGGAHDRRRGGRAGGATAALVAPITRRRAKAFAPQFLKLRAIAAHVVLMRWGHRRAARGRCTSKGAHGVAAIRSVWAASDAASTACAIVTAVRASRG